MRSSDAEAWLAMLRIGANAVIDYLSRRPDDEREQRVQDEMRCGLDAELGRLRDVIRLRLGDGRGEMGGLAEPPPAALTPAGLWPTPSTMPATLGAGAGRVMCVSPAGLALIKHYESYAARAYTCPAGRRTIGYGHVIRSGEPYGARGYEMSTEEATRVLDLDCDTAEAAVRRLVTAPIEQHEFDALVSFVFNIGAGAFAGSTLLAKLNAGDDEGAAAEFDRWVKANGKRLPGLVLRRNAEETMFRGMSA
jgi:lysozyme